MVKENSGCCSNEGKLPAASYDHIMTMESMEEEEEDDNESNDIMNEDEGLSGDDGDLRSSPSPPPVTSAQPPLAGDEQIAFPASLLKASAMV